MRNEIKIPINEEFSLIFDCWKDFKNKISRPYKDRIVNSIYYDDEEFETAQDNLSGISDRRKYRLRWYGNEFKNYIYEIKVKKNNLGKKISLKSEDNLAKTENMFSFTNKFLHKKENRFFLNYIDNLNLKPKLKVSYIRSYYLYEGKIRITYDQKINYSLANTNSSGINLTRDSMNVVEIKFEPENINFAFKLIKESKFIPKRFSKYLRGLHLLGIANYI